MDEFDTLVEGGFVVSVQVGQVNLEPAQAANSERLGLAEEEKATGEIVTDVVQMRWKGVCAATEVQVVWEVEGITDELRYNQYKQ